MQRKRLHPDWCCPCAVEGKSGLKPFGQPPETTTKAEAEGPGATSEGKPATKDTMDSVGDTGGTAPGQGSKTKPPEEEGLGSGNAPVGERS